ncbi:MAG: SAM-dependent methyltransferase [Verrucomicrobiota bacterium]
MTTPDAVVDGMLTLAGVGAGDCLFDLGSGDGRIVIAAARKYGARGVGIEYDATLIAQSRENARREGVSDRVEFRREDIFASDFSNATVVTMYLLPEVNLDLRPRILFDLRPGTRVVSHDWDMGDWEPDDRRVLRTAEKAVWPLKESTAYLWIVPARVAGYWRGTLKGPEGEEPVILEFAQRFQSASARVWLRRWTLEGTGRIRGNEVSLDLDRSEWKPGAHTLHFSLRVAKDRVEGEARDGLERIVLHATRITD